MRLSHAVEAIVVLSLIVWLIFDTGARVHECVQHRVQQHLEAKP